MSSGISAKEAVVELTTNRGHDVDLSKVLVEFNPDHVHWKEEPWGFQTGPDLYKWLYTKGLPFFLQQKLFPDRNISLKEVSRRLFEKYFAYYEIRGDIEVAGEGLLDYHTGVKIEPHIHAPLWPARNVVRLFPEVDFRIQFEYPDAPDKQWFDVRRETYILLNTTKVEAERYKPHLLGHPLQDNQVRSLISGRGYLERVDTWLQQIGLPQGIDGLVATESSARLIQAFAKAK